MGLWRSGYPEVLRALIRNANWLANSRRSSGISPVRCIPVQKPGNWRLESPPALPVYEHGVRVLFGVRRIDFPSLPPSVSGE